MGRKHSPKMVGWYAVQRQQMDAQFILKKARLEARKETQERARRGNRARLWGEYLALGDDVLREATFKQICGMLECTEVKLRKAIEENSGDVHPASS